MRSKIHKATVTKTNLDYVGSISVDEFLIESAGFLPGEKVLIADNTNGARLETYLITAPKDSGEICVQGAAAHLIKQNDIITIMGFELADKPIKAKIILVSQGNKFLKFL